nr:glycosyltransferase family 2 protein [Methylonatrum kenyense]
MISVITPTFNRASFLGQAVESILGQSHSRLELLVVDDGSTDGTRALMQRYLGDERVRYFHQENQGQSAARRFALGQARGEFIAFLDSDNIAAPTRLATCLGALQQSRKYDVAYGDVIKIDGDGNEISRSNIRRYSGRILPQMLQENCVSMNTALARRCVFDSDVMTVPHRRVADDYEMWLRISARHRFLYLAEYLAYYRVMREQISSDKIGRFDANEAILNDFLREYRGLITSAELRAGWSGFMLRKGEYHASQGRIVAALQCYMRALRHTPGSRRPWRFIARLAAFGLIRSRNAG